MRIGRLLIATLSCSAALSAHAQTFGAWRVYSSAAEGLAMAISTNDSGQGLFKACGETSCFWVVTFNATCEDGNSYPAMMTSGAGSMSLDLTCKPTAQIPGRLIMSNPDAVDAAVRSGGIVGLAVPMKNGDFRVSRYRVSGWDGAEKQLIENARKLPASTRERTL
jgi:hypothetical protein